MTANSISLYTRSGNMKKLTNFLSAKWVPSQESLSKRIRAQISSLVFIFQRTANSQRRYLDYQVNIGNRIIELLTSGNPEDQLKAAGISAPKTRFQDLMDELFSETGKSIIRKSNEIQFVQDGDILTPYQLSSGEKQMLVILLTVLVQDNEHCTLFMDEPEISLHVEWQQKLISLIRKLNPNVQIVLTTHSPAVIMNGWVDSVTEVSDITTK